MQTNILKKVQEEAYKLFERKNQDYGNTFSKFGLIGILIRLQDKIDRCLTLLDNVAQVKSESIKDTLIDTSNYACMGICILKGEYKDISELMIEVHKESLIKLVGENQAEDISETFLEFNNEMGNIIKIAKKNASIEIGDRDLMSFFYKLHIQAALFAEKM